MLRERWNCPFGILSAHAPQGRRHALIVAPLDVDAVEQDPGALGHIGGKAAGMLQGKGGKCQAMAAAPRLSAGMIERQESLEAARAIVAFF